MSPGPGDTPCGRWRQRVRSGLSGADIPASGGAALIWQCRLAPQLLMAGLAGRAEIMVDQGKAAAADHPLPGLEAVEAGVTAIDEALLVLATRVGHEQYAARLQRGVQAV